MEDTLELTLRRPVKIGDGAELTVLHLAEPIAEQLRKAASAANAIAGDLDLITLVAEIGPAEAAALGARDFAAARDFLRQFIRDETHTAEDRAVEDLFEFALEKPVKIGNVEAKTLTLKEPTAGQLRQAAMGENGVAQDIILVHLVANIDIALVSKLCARDVMRAARWLGNFPG